MLLFLNFLVKFLTFTELNFHFAINLIVSIILYCYRWIIYLFIYDIKSLLCLIFIFVVKVIDFLRLLEVHITWLLRFWSAVMDLRWTFGALVWSFTFCYVEFPHFGQVILILTMHSIPEVNFYTNSFFFFFIFLPYKLKRVLFCHFFWGCAIL